MLLAVSVVLNVILLIVLVSIAISRASQPPASGERPRPVVDRIDTVIEADPLEDTVSFGDELPYPGDGLDPAESLPTSDRRTLEELADRAMDPPYIHSEGVDLTDHGPASLEAQKARSDIAEAHRQHVAGNEVLGDCEFCVAQVGLGGPRPEMGSATPG